VAHQRRERRWAAQSGLAGKGNAGAHGGVAGDLYVIIRIGEHPVFRRDGDDIT